MFLESLLETSAQARTRRGWATLTSFLIEAAVIGGLIILPMARPDALPAAMRWTGTIFSPPPGEAPPPGLPPTSAQHTAHVPVSELDERGIPHVPTVVPDRPYVPTEPEALPPGVGDTYVPGVPGGTGTRATNGMMRELLEGTRTVTPAPPPPSKPVIISHVEEGMLIRRVQPAYPQLALVTHVQGTVVLKAIIGRDGVIRHVEVLSGPPLLVRAAADAVMQWRYRPFYLSGQPVEVETQITVNFVLAK